ncbi:hybrid sensor histidine kinase/response regulator [Hydrogenophaga sp. PAMC20947]|uniref:hybrid sensor histidine kinase/response regulator n=1 Tax=Hydrogenophaga sp. PAMC20947 TaxID=2565558 RepID=UPI00109DE9F7|nr:hybrid sensor histidine kinase/response regulator [Hydrogenophaga sp. PAMC20947]QCB45659.1 hybrid sensor histidine kinase/response regulator [Hydrogenophaga sp. PAMC20947]
MSRTPHRRRVSLGPTLVVAMVLAALAPALIASYLLSANSYESIETLAENAMSQAAHRVDVGALAHLGESHTVVNALVPPFNAAGAEGERTRRWFKDTALFETMAYALTQQSVNVPYLYIGAADGSFFGVEREPQGFVVREIRPGDSGRTHYLINTPGDRSQLIKTETSVYDPRKRPWYQLAATTGKRVFTDVYRSAVKNQFDLTLAQPIYEADGKTLMGVMAVDMSLARLTDLIRSTRISENAVTYLVDGQGRMVASSVDEDLSVMAQQKSQRITPMQSVEPLVRDSFAQLSARRGKTTLVEGGMIQLQTQDNWWHRLGLGGTNRLMALQRPFGSKYQLDWQLIVVAPEQDFTQHVISARQWALFSIAALIGLSALLAYGVARGLSRQFRQLNASALAVGAGELPEVQHSAPFKEVYTLSQVMHDSATKLRLSNAEIAQKNHALQEAAQLLEARVGLRTAELAASREEALAAVRAKAGFLAVMSHEIRTPLHGVVGMSELLSESSLDATQQELLGVLKVSSDQLLAVVDDILDFSKIESGHLQLEEEPLNVRATLSAAVDIMRGMAQEKGLHLSLQVAPDVPQAIEGDAVRLRQILLNLLSNAIKFTSQGEVAMRVWLAVKEQKHTLWFSVADSGIGISQQKLPDLFKPFAQGDTATARVYGGTGLGLMICKHLVELMGGQISVESAPGTGSTFRFSIRCEPVAASAVAPAAEQGPSHESHPQRILVVDDNSVNLKVASAMLARLGYPHLSVASGEHALNAIGEAHRSDAPFAIVLLDSHMPDMDGQATAQAIRTQWGSAAPVMIGISASTLGEDQQRCLAAGMSDYLPKPLELKRLADALAHWCQPKQVGEQALEGTGACEPDPIWIDRDRWFELGECEDAAQTLRKDMVQDFLGSLPKRLDAIQKASDSSDEVGLFKSAHALKGSADNLGAKNLAHACAALETEAPDDGVLPARLHALNQAVQGTRQALADYLSNGKANG